MARVTVTGWLWEFSRARIPANLQPELWFKPDMSRIVLSWVMPAREVKAELDASSGEFTVQLESAAGLTYRPVVRWLADPSQADEDVENRARGYAEFPPIFPADGGPIGTLPQSPIQINGVWYGYGPPPSYLTDGLYFDISGVKPVLYAPPGGNL